MSILNAVLLLRSRLPVQEELELVSNLLQTEFHRNLTIFFNFSVTNKVTAGAKSFGSFLAGAVSKAGARIKETVKDNVSRPRL